MIILSGVLVVLAIALLVTGIVTGNTGHEVLGLDGLKLIYVSIGVSIVSALFLAVGVFLRRKELFGTAAAPATAKASAGRASTRPARAKARVGADGDTPAVPVTSATLTDVPAETTVYVVPGRKRYHLETCRQLSGRDREELTFVEAREEGFTPCTACLPDMALAARAAAGDDATRTSDTAAAPGETSTRPQETPPAPVEVTRTDLPVTLAMPGDQEQSATRRGTRRAATGRSAEPEAPAAVTRETALPAIGESAAEASASGAATTAPHETAPPSTAATPADTRSSEAGSYDTGSPDARSADARASETAARESAPAAEPRIGRAARRRSLFEPLEHDEDDAATPTGEPASGTAPAETAETAEPQPAEAARAGAEPAGGTQAETATGTAAEAATSAGQAGGSAPDTRSASSAADADETAADTHDAGAGSAARSADGSSAGTEDREDAVAGEPAGDDTDDGAVHDEAERTETHASTADGTSAESGAERDTGGASADEGDAVDRAADDAATEAGERAAVDTAAETSGGAEPPAVRILSGTKRYHRPDCALIEDIAADADDLESLSRAEAEERGCTPCLVCQPDSDPTL